MSADRLATTLVQHHPIVQDGRISHCACGVMAIWRTGQYVDQWEWHAAHQAEAVRAAGLLAETTTEWGMRYPGTETVLPVTSEAAAREWAPKILWRGQPCELVWRPARKVTAWREA